MKLLPNETITEAYQRIAFGGISETAKTDVDPDVRNKYNIDKLAKAFNSLDKVDPTSPTWKKVEAAMDKMPPEALKLIVDGKIKFLMWSAITILKYKHKIKYAPGMNEALDGKELDLAKAKKALKDAMKDKVSSSVIAKLRKDVDDLSEAQNCDDEDEDLNENPEDGYDDDEDEDDIDEAKIKKVVRGGKIVKKVDCKPGFKAQDGKCVKISAKEKISRSKGAKKGAKKKKGKSAQIAKKALRSKKKGKNL